MVIFPEKAEDKLSRDLGFLPWRKYLGHAEGAGVGLIPGEGGEEVESGVNPRRGWGRE